MSDEVDDFLAHYGVKGMRWGYRKPTTPYAVAKVQSSVKKRHAQAEGRMAKAEAAQNLAIGKVMATSKRSKRGRVARQELIEMNDILDSSIKTMDAADRFVRKLEKRAVRVDKQISKMSDKKVQKVKDLLDKHSEIEMAAVARYNEKVEAKAGSFASRRALKKVEAATERRKSTQSVVESNKFPDRKSTG